MVSPINLISQVDNFKSQTEFDNGTAIGMPPIYFHNRKTGPITNLNNSNSYSPDYNPIKRFVNRQAPSTVLTEAFLKSRILLGPVFMHNEAATKYSMISKVSDSTMDIRKYDLNITA